MRLTSLALIVVPLVLSACAVTPRQQCQAPYRAELRNIEAEIRDSREALQRGFRLVPARWEHGINYCLSPSGFVSLCTAEDGEPMYDKRPISRPAEQAKLDALLGERGRLNAALAQCAAQFPE